MVLMAVCWCMQRAKEGFMEKMNPKGIWQKRWFILHLKHLYYFDEPNVRLYICVE